LAKDLVNNIDQHLNSETRSYLFVSPGALASTAETINAGSTNFRVMIGALVNAIYNQAGFRDWIEAETVNSAIKTLNKRADQLLALFKAKPGLAQTLQPSVQALLPQFQLGPAELTSARDQLRKQFATEYGQLSAPAADIWLDSILILELAADLHTRDEMYIYSVSADRKDLAGAGLFAFFGFLYRDFREHDYDLGRQKAQTLLTKLDVVSGGRLPKLAYVPQPIRPIKATPAGGFTASLIPKDARKSIHDALSQAADNLLKEMGIGWVTRKGIETFYLNGKLNGMLGL
jgi:hypothetical protein